MIIGPNGNFPLGAPMAPQDRGDLYASISIIKPLRLVVMNFGTTLSWLAIPPELALKHALMFRTAIESVFGKLSVDPRPFPFKVTANKEKRIVETDLCITVSLLAANPELFLVWADKLEAAANELL